MRSIVITVTNVNINSSAGNSFLYNSLGGDFVNDGNESLGSCNGATGGGVTLIVGSFGASFGLSIISGCKPPSTGFS